MSPSKSYQSTSSQRLWALIESRTRPDADVEAIDRRIWDLFGEEWAIMFTDLAGFSRQTSEFGILHFLQIIHEQRKLLLPIVESHDGLLVKSEADSLMVLFRHPEGALDCAMAMQQACRRINDRRTPNEQILLCVGIGYGELLRIGDDDVWGREVNAASKLGEDTAQPHEVLVTDAVREALEADPRYHFEPIQAVTGSPANFRVSRSAPSEPANTE